MKTRYIALEVFGDGSGWMKLAEFETPELPLSVLQSGLSEGFTHRILVVASAAEWPKSGSWGQVPAEPIEAGR